MKAMQGYGMQGMHVQCKARVAYVRHACATHACAMQGMHVTCEMQGYNTTRLAFFSAPRGGSPRTVLPCRHGQSWTEKTRPQESWCVVSWLAGMTVEGSHVHVTKQSGHCQRGIVAVKVLCELQCVSITMTACCPSANISRC